MVSYAEADSQNYRGDRRTHPNRGSLRVPFVASILLILIGVSALAAQPVITGVAIPDTSMKIDDIVTATISVQSDSATVYTLNASNIGGYALGSLSKQNSTTYTAVFTITEGGTDYGAGADIPTSVTLADGGLTDTWSTAISQASDPIDANRPTDPTPSSNSHTVSVWDNDNTVDVQVSGASDPGGSGVDGFEIEWDQSAAWTPTEAKEQEETWTGATFTATANGDWYFHIATVDNAGNWTSTKHLGPFQIDITPPSVPANLDPVDGAYTNDISPTLSWDASTDTGGSGMRDTQTYRVVITGTPSRDYYTANTTYIPTLAEGVFTWKVYSRDNAGNNSNYTVDYTLTIDITDPTDPTPSSSSHTVSVVSNDTTVDIGIAGASDPVSNGATSGVDGFDTAWDKNATWTATEVKDQEESWTGGTFTATSDGDWYFHIATVDNAGNWTSTEHLGPFRIDTDPPAVSSVTVNDTTITDADTPGTATFEVTVDFDEAMDTAVDPTLTFNPVVGTTLALNGGESGWTDADTYVAKYNVADAGVDVNSVTIDVTGAQDPAGNGQENYTPEHEFEIDTLNPTVGIVVSDQAIYDGDVGVDAFTVTATYSEAMEPATIPTLTFTPNPATTLTNWSGTWSGGNTVYTWTTDIEDAGVEIDDIDMTVSGGKDVVGNDQVSNTLTDHIDIDTLNPTITSITSTTSDGYYGLGLNINVTVSFSEPVTLTGGTLDVTLDTPGDVVGLAAFGPSTSSFTTYTIGAGDNSCDLDAIGVMLNGGTLRDNVGNDAIVGLPATTIADGSDITVDTTDPVISGLDLPDTEQSVDANCSITIPYSAVVTDNCCVNASDVTVVVEFVSGAGTAILIAPPATIVNNGIDQVDVFGNFTVSDLTAGDVVIRVRINAIDCTGNAAAEASDTVTIGDITIPVISGLDLPDGDQSVDEFCSITIPYSAIVVDNCCLDAGSVNVVVEFVDPFNTAVLTTPPAVIVNSGGGVPNDTVTVSGSFTVSDLTGDPIHVRVRIDGTDCNGNAAIQANDTVVIIDSTIPVIVWNTELPPSPQYVDPMTCTIALPILATVTDNCCILAGNVSVDISVTNASLAHAVTVTQMGDAVVVAGIITVSNLTGCPAVLFVAIDATDCCGNDAAQLTDEVDIRDNTIPVINDLMFNIDDTYIVPKTVPYLVDECGLVVVYFSGNVTDNCCITPGNVIVTATLPMSVGEGPAILEDFEYTPVQNGQTQVDFTGSAVVRCLESCPPGVCMSRVQINVTAADCCGNNAVPVATETDEGLVNDDILPIPRDDPRQDMMMDESAIIDPLVEVRLDEFGTYRLILRESTPVRIDVMANDADNSSHNEAHPFAPCVQCGSCGGQTGCCGVMYIDEIVEHPSYGTVTIEDDEGNCAGGTVIRYAPDRGYLGPDCFTYRTRDAFGNISSVIATVYLQVVPEVWMEDVFVIACEGEPVEFRVEAADLFIDPDDPEIIQFVFSIDGGPEHGVVGGSLLDVIYTPPSMVTDPQFGMQVPSLDFSEAATIVLTYTPADGFLGIDQLRIRFEDPFGGVAIAVVNITVGRCVDVTASSVIHVIQGEFLPLVVPISFASMLEAGMGTVTLLSLEAGTLYPDVITVEWSEAINRHILTLNTTGLPLGSYELKIPLGTGEIVTLTIEVGEAE